jgi:indole-3-glycerol phosphate synthase
MLGRGQLVELLDVAAEHGLFVLLEAFDASDLGLASELLAARNAGTVLVGVNCRDLQTLQVVQQRFAMLAPALPADRPCVAESGVGTPFDACSMRRLGYRLALIGTALMGVDDPDVMLAEILHAARTVQA